MRTGRFFILLLLTAAALPQLRADIFSLLPFSPRNPASLTALSDSMGPKRFWKEKINVNGTDMFMEIFLIDRSLRDIAAQVRQGKKQNIAVFANSNSLLLEEPGKDGSLLRTYYLELSSVRPVLQFKMLIPAGRKTMKAADWPSELPLVAGAEELTCMRFPARNALYGGFLVRKAVVPQVLSDMSDRIAAKGWNPVSREADNVFKGSGEVFMKENPSSIMILGIARDSSGKGVRVSIYTRNL